MASARGISLWLVPEEALCAPLGLAVEGLARRLASPPFLPHVTLLAGSLDQESTVIAEAKALAAMGPVRSFRLLDLVFHPEYFRAAVLEAERSPDLLERHAEARGRLSPGFSRPFAPHASLVYGRPDLLGDGDREAIRTAAAPFAGVEFVPESLEVVRTEGPVEMWKLLASIPMR